MSLITAASVQVVHRQIDTVMHLQGRIMTLIIRINDGSFAAQLINHSFKEFQRNGVRATRVNGNG